VNEGAWVDGTLSAKRPRLESSDEKDERIKALEEELERWKKRAKKAEENPNDAG